MDVADMLQEHMPNYYALLQSDKAFADCAYNSDGSMSQIVSRGSTFINNGLNVRADWLRELGMDTPTTVEELTDFMEMFHQEIRIDIQDRERYRRDAEYI